MIYPVFCVKDDLTGFDANFLVQLNEESAKRAFEYSCNNPNLQNFKPADFSLYKVADFDSESGEMVATYPPKFIINGRSCVIEK